MHEEEVPDFKQILLIPIWNNFNARRETSWLRDIRHSIQANFLILMKQKWRIYKQFLTQAEFAESIIKLVETVQT